MLLRGRFGFFSMLQRALAQERVRPTTMALRRRLADAVFASGGPAGGLCAADISHSSLILRWASCGFGRKAAGEACGARARGPTAFAHCAPWSRRGS